MNEYLSVFKYDRCIADKVEYGNRFIKRFLGLMGRKNIADNEGIYLIPCRSIHTLYMKIPIDVLFLSEKNVVLDIANCLKPGRLRAGSKNVRSILELSSNKIDQCNIEIGDEIIIKKTFSLKGENY